jgi:5-methylcytosine-specific restriction protein B
MPDSKLLQNASAGGSIPLGPWLAALNTQILNHIGRDARNLQIGHAYFLDGEKPVTDLNRFARILQDDILPLLEEYCYEDFSTLAKIVGAGLVDEAGQRIRHELFEAARRDDLIQAVLSPFPDIIATVQAISADSESLEDEQEEDDDLDDVSNDDERSL